MGNQIWTIQEDAYLMHGVRHYNLAKESKRQARKNLFYISDIDEKAIKLAEKLSER